MILWFLVDTSTAARRRPAAVADRPRRLQVPADGRRSPGALDAQRVLARTGRHRTVGGHRTGDRRAGSWPRDDSCTITGTSRSLPSYASSSNDGSCDEEQFIGRPEKGWNIWCPRADTQHTHTVRPGSVTEARGPSRRAAPVGALPPPWGSPSVVVVRRRENAGPELREPDPTAGGRAGVPAEAPSVDETGTAARGGGGVRLPT